MRILSFLPLLAAMGCGNGGDLSSREGVLDAQISSMEDFTDAIEGITDKKSAEAAKPKLEAIVKRMQETAAAGKKLGEPTGDEKKRLEAKMEAATKKLDPRMQKIMERLQGDPEAMMVIAGVMAQLGSMGR